MSTSVAAASEVLTGSTVESAGAPGGLRRLSRRPLAVSCIVFILVVIGIAIVAPIAMPEINGQGAGDLLAVLKGPSWQHPLGTDGLGRDVLDRILVGTRLTMVATAEAVIVGTFLGVPLGLAAGFIGGRLDRFVAWLTDLSFSMPALVIVLVVAAIFPRSILAMMVTFGILSAPGLARVVRAVTLPVREELYIAAARVSGLTGPYIVSRHVLPRIAGVVIVQTALTAAGSVGITAGLAFLGVLGVNRPSWGAMVQDGISVLFQQPWLIWPPGIAIGLTVLAFTLLGDAVQDVTAETWSQPVTRRRPRPAAASTEYAPLDAVRAASLLSVEHLTVSFLSAAGPMAVIEDVTFDIRPGETVGIVGESGCGKTMTAMAILGLLPGAGEITGGSIVFGGRDLHSLTERELLRLRGQEIGLISQEPMAGLTPTFRVGYQIARCVRRHHGVSRRAARQRTLELLAQVRLPDPELVARRYPHELSGGMAQRVAIARALAGEPKLLIADEPTTALDVTVQSEILELLRQLQQEREMAILLITHDWGVIADLCDRAVVMYAGELVERADLEAVFHEPLHPYTEALLASNPQDAAGRQRLPTIPGVVPKPGAWPEGCHFHPRCSYATAGCVTTPVTLARPDGDRETRCLHHDLLRRSP
jgi:peptide/nickel transport system permease protein